MYIDIILLIIAICYPFIFKYIEPLLSRLEIIGPEKARI